VRPPAPDGRRYGRYSQAIRDLDPPRLFENHISYRLHHVAWDPRQPPRDGSAPRTLGEPWSACGASSSIQQGVWARLSWAIADWTSNG
jgi:hypothetical protein